MTKYNPKNERIKRDYFRYQKEARRKADTTLTGIHNALSGFEKYTTFKDFATFNKEQAIAFKKHLAARKAKRTGEPISKATVLSILNALKEFFRWLAWQPSYKSRMHVPDIEYFNLSDKEISIAKAAKHKNFPTLEQIHKTIFSMPTETDIHRRNRALIAFAILTGMRDNALASLRLKHVDLTRNPVLIRQEPDMVRTKFSKQIFTFLFPVGDKVQAVALDWIKELRDVKLYGQNDPIFPRTKLGHDKNMSFTAQGLEPECWETTASIRKIFREAFEGAGLPYFHPHLFRHTLSHLGQETCRTPEQFKAWSQNLGHENPLTTFTSYSHIDPYRQGEVIRGLNYRREKRGQTRSPSTPCRRKRWALIIDIYYLTCLN
ncbi:MAG: site-specific integrase [Alphaproteobacteria bacterium]|nr:site-specific integrase [Alphaproteobacteria bacterium]